MKQIKNINYFKEDFLESSLSLSDDELKIDSFLARNFMKQIYKKIISNSKILVVGDYDVDGFFSGIQLSLYLKLLEERVNGNLSTKIDTFYNKREYGYEIPKKIFDELHSSYDLIILLDTGATYSYLNKDTKNVLVIDHHPNDNEEYDYIYNPNKNNNISTSTGRIVYEMITDFEDNMRVFFGKDKIKPHDLIKVLKMYAGITLCSDMASMSYDNKIFLEQSLKLMSDNKKNLTFLKNIPSKNISSIDISFNLINEINGYSRMNKDLKDLEYLFKYEVDNKSLLSPASTKEQVSILNLLKTNNDSKKVILKNLQEGIINRLSTMDLSNKDVLIIKIDNNYTGLNGLLSQNILGMYLKSNIVVSFDSNRNEYVGSGRGALVKKSLEKMSLDYSNLGFSFGGHEMAIGITIDKNSIDSFFEIYNNLKFEEEIKNDFNVYSSNIKEYKNAIDSYSMLSPTTLIDSKFYILLENYDILSNQIITKNNWLTTTLVDESGILTIYFDSKIKEKLEKREPIILEITNNKGTQFVKNIDFIKDNGVDISNIKSLAVNQYEDNFEDLDNFIKYNFN